MGARIGGGVFDALRVAVAAVDCVEFRDAYREGRYPRSEGVRDVDRRYRWDLYYAASGRARRDGVGWCLDGLDVTSDHIDTALRRIVSPLAGVGAA